jgi:hypothetical protein
MGNTWIVDQRHYLDASGALADMPPRARLLAEYFASIVVDATANLDEEPSVRCRRRQDNAAVPVPSCLILLPMTWTAFTGTAPSATTMD